MDAECSEKPPSYNVSMATNLPGYNKAMATNLPDHPVHELPTMSSSPTRIPTAPPSFDPRTGSGDYPSDHQANLPGPQVVTQQPQQAVVASATPEKTKFPCSVHCRTCNKSVTTKVVMETSKWTHLVSLMICFFGGWVLCLCLIPYFTDFSKDAVHKCPDCKAHLGTCEPFDSDMKTFAASL